MQYMSNDYHHMIFGDVETQRRGDEWSGDFFNCVFYNVDFGDWYDPQRFFNCEFYGCVGIPEQINNPIYLTPPTEEDQ